MIRQIRWRAALLIILVSRFVCQEPFAEASSNPYGLVNRPAAKAFLRMPSDANGTMPRLLSQTGAFQDVSTLTVADGLIPYDLIVPFWSDGAEKARWISVSPDRTIHFAPTGAWRFPAGTVFVKSFSIATNELDPNSLRRLETRLLVCENGGVYGVTYRWRADESDAELLATNLTEAITIHTPVGVRTQYWYYPSRADCLTCHTPAAGGVLGVTARQLNRELTFPSGVRDNELRAWNHARLFDTNLGEARLAEIPTLAAIDDMSRSLEDRARSYLDANCAQCHRPKGTVAYFDARYETRLSNQNLINGNVLFDERIDGAHVIAPNDIWRSILFMRLNTTEPFKMPPLARNTIDERGIDMLRQWINSQPGPPVLPPPKISPAGGHFSKAVEVVLESEPDATIFYTLDGTVPTKSDLRYDKPIHLTNPTILRVKAFKPGFTRSITATETFLIDG